MTKNNINIGEIFSYVRACAGAIALRGALSLAIVVTLLALYYAFAPRQERYRQEVVITLESQNGQVVYPNNRLFSSVDLISAPVLMRVWNERQLGDRVKFEDFCEWFSLTGYNCERVKLDSEYQTKMSKRNITVTELMALQREYEAKLAALSANNRYVLAMRPTGCCWTREEMVEILSAVPNAWFAETSVLNAPQMPSIMRADALSAYVKRLKAGDGRSLELIDALRLYRDEIEATCKYIRDQILRGRNVVVNGMNLGEYEARLDMAHSEILRLKNRLLIDGDPADLEGFVAARLDDMACETMSAEEKAKAVRQTIDLLKDTAGAETEGLPRRGAPADGNVTLQADASFFKDFTAMVRRDASQESVQKFADELLKYTKDLAEIKARKLYYDQIGQYVAKTRARAKAKNSSEALFAQTEAFATDMLEIGEKVTAFRDTALKIYRTSDQFYALPSPAQYGKSYPFSLLRMALGLLALWALYNIVMFILSWNAAKMR